MDIPEIHTLFINLDDRTDRKDEFISQFPTSIQTKLNIERFSAIRRSPGFLGCTLSHIQCIQLAKERGWENILIFEDDFELLVRPQEFYNKFKDLLYESWDVCVISGFIHKVEDISGKNNFKRLLDGQSAVAYAVRRHYYDTLLENYREGFAHLEADNSKYSLYALDQYWKHLQAKDNWIVSNPILGRQRYSYSNIEQKMISYDSAFLQSAVNKTMLPSLVGLIILNCKKYEGKRINQINTWLRDISSCGIHIWYHIQGDPTLSAPVFDNNAHILYVPCADDYLSLPLKSYLAFKSMYDRFPHLQYILKTDDDMDCNMDALTYQAKNLPISNVDYVGFMIKSEFCLSTYHYKYVKEEERTPKIQFGGLYANGAYYGLSRKAIRWLLENKKIIESAVFEDNIIGHIMSQNPDIVYCKVGDRAIFKEYV